MYFTGFRPEKIDKTKFKVELFNEFGIIILSYMMICFTGFVLDR